jgi:hypothetical protein
MWKMLVNTHTNSHYSELREQATAVLAGYWENGHNKGYDNC